MELIDNQTGGICPYCEKPIDGGYCVRVETVETRGVNTAVVNILLAFVAGILVAAGFAMVLQ